MIEEEEVSVLGDENKDVVEVGVLERGGEGSGGGLWILIGL